jgi:hypothetical protein
VKTITLRGHHFKDPLPISDLNDPAYIRFSSRAPNGSWKCNECTEKWRRPTDAEGVAIWNKVRLVNEYIGDSIVDSLPTL